MKRIVGEGMHFKDNTGDLYVKFNIAMPEKISKEQKHVLRELFGEKKHKEEHKTSEEEHKTAEEEGETAGRDSPKKEKTNNTPHTPPAGVTLEFLRRMEWPPR